MADKETRIRITAVDDTTRTLNSIRAATRDLTGDFGKLGGALSAIGVTGALAGISAMVKSAIDAAASMADLSQKTGIAVKELTALDYAMRREGVSTEAFAKGMQQLSKSMVDAGDATSKAGKLFQALGVNVNSGPREALLKLADSFKSLPDGATKSALAMELLGKAGTDMIPALNNGAAGIREMEEEARKLGITFDADLGRAAKEFSDKMFALKESTKVLGITLAQDMLPGLNRITAAMLEAAKESGLLMALWVALGGVMSEALSLNDDEAQLTKKRIKEIGDELERLGEIKVRDLGNGILDKSAWIQAQEQAKALREELQQLTRVAKAVADARAGKFEDSNDRRARQGVDLSVGARVNSVLSGADKPQADPTRNLLIGLQLEYTKLNSVTKENETLERVLSEFKKEAYAQANKDLKDQAIAQAKLIDEKKKELAVDALRDAEHQKDIAAAAARAQALEELSSQWAEATEQLEIELKLLGLTNLDREKAVLLEKARADIMAAGGNAAAIRDIKENLEKQLSLLDAIYKKQADINRETARWDELSSRAADFFTDLVMNGKSAFDRLKQSVKGLFAEMVQLFAKRWLLNLAAGGTMLGSATNAVASLSDSASLAGTAFNVVGAGATLALGTTGAGALGATAGGAFAQGAMGIGTGVWATGSAGAMGSSLAGVYSALAAIPVWGWIAMAVIAIGAWIAGNHKGGPKIGGSFMGGFDSQGMPTGSVPVPGSDNGRFFTPNQGDSAMQQLVATTAGGFFSALGRLGGTTRGFNFGLGFDHDPHGTAMSRVSSSVTDADGNVIYSTRDRNMDDKEVPAALQLEAQRMIFAALQASELPEGIAEIIDSLDVKNATAEQIAAALNLAAAYKALGDTIAAIEGGPVVALQQQLDAMKRRVSEAGSALTEAIKGGDHQAILNAQQELTAAIIDRYNAEMQMIRDLQGAIRQADQAAYQFALNIAGRINAVGGSRDIGGIAMNRATTLRAGVGANSSNPVNFQIEDVQNYVGAIDTWYNARRDAITRDAEAQASAAQAILNAQKGAAQARVSALEKELQLAQSFQGLVDRTKEMLDEMRLSSMNPLPVTGRLALAGADVEAARAIYQTSTGSGRIDAANKLLDALTRQRDLGMEAFDRPSEEWQTLYNAIVSEITAIQGDAKPLAERAVEIQEQLLDAQRIANGLASATVDASQFAAAATAALDAEARGYYEWAEAEGARLYGIQRQEAQTLLDTITGGMEPNLYIAKRTGEVVEELKGLRSDVREGLRGRGAGNLTVNVTVNNSGGTLDPNAVVSAVRIAAPQINRVLADA